MISIDIDPGQIKELREALKGVKAKLPREIATAVNATARTTRTAAARELRSDLSVPVRILKKSIAIKGKATKNNTSAVIRFWGGYPIPLKYFGAKQTKKSGVTFKISPRHNRRSVIRDAFIARQYGGNVYRRKGKPRGPLEKLHGPSPGESFEKAGVLNVALATAKKELPKQMKRRINLMLLRAAGTVPQRKGS